MNTFDIYRSLPVWLQDVMVQLYSLKIARTRYGRDFQKLMRQLAESEKWDQQQICAYKIENISKILNYAYNHTRFYRRHFDRHGVSPSDFVTLDDLKKFPVLTKDDIRENLYDMVSDEYPAKRLMEYHTSGTTGKALNFYWTRENLAFYWAVVWRGRSRFGCLPTDEHLNFTGKMVVPIEQCKPPYWRYKRFEHQYMLNMQHITHEKTPAIVDFINRHGFKFFAGYPSIMNSLAVTIADLGLTVVSPPKYIFSSAEKIYDYQRRNIEKAFPGVIIVEHYGFSENVACASMDTDLIYHEDFELGHLELKDSRQVNDGYRGAILATGFKNYGMPFIRYEIGDNATFNSDGMLTGIEGRLEDYILTPEGTKIMRMDYVFKKAHGIKESQIIQTSPDKILIRYVKSDGFSDDSLSLIKAEVRRVISPTLITEFEEVAEIPRTKSGKFKAVIGLSSNKETEQ